MDDKRMMVEGVTEQVKLEEQDFWHFRHGIPKPFGQSRVGELTEAKKRKINEAIKQRLTEVK